MPEKPRQPFLDIAQAGDLTEVRFTPTTALDEETVWQIGRQLIDLLAHRPQPKVLILFGVETQLTSSMLGRLIAVHKEAEAAGGRLALCATDPLLHRAIRECRLDELFNIYQDELEARQSFEQSDPGVDAVPGKE